MNLVEHYIKEIHEEKESKNNPNYIIVDLTCDCYGRIYRTTHITTKEQWEIDKAKGYFMG